MTKNNKNVICDKEDNLYISKWGFMNKSLFIESITDSFSWHKCSKSGALIPLLKHIYESNHIKFGDVSPIPAGVSEIFQVNNTIVKLFPPPEAKIGYDDKFYQTELSAMNFCKSAGVLTPDIICHGIVNDCVYSFPYILMVHIDGIEARKIVPNYSNAEKTDFALKLKEITSRIYIPTNIDIPRYNDSEKINSNSWNSMPEAFREDRKHYLANSKFPDPVFQHGDLWDGNIFIDKQGCLVLIDFAESLIAPSYYDMGPMILNGGYDSIRLEAYFGDYRNDVFYDTFTTAWLLNWFGATFIEWSAKDMGIDFKSLTSVNTLKNMIVKMFNNL